MNHPKMSELLPWYVNGTLDTGDRQAAALEVASCDECAREIEDLTRLQAAMLELDADAPALNDAAFARALAAVEEEEAKKRLGHPWLGWWWALTPFRRAVAVSAVLGAAVIAALFVVPKRENITATALSGQTITPISFEAGAGNAPVDGSLARPTNALQPDKLVSGAAAVAPASGNSGVQLAESGGIGLRVPDVESTISALMRIARTQAGAVVSLDDQTPTQPGVRHTAHLDLLVPDNRFDATVAMVSKLGGVQTRTIDAVNVEGQIVDSQARIRNLQRAEGDYLKIMDRAGSMSDVLSVENEVSATREQIEELTGQVQALKHQIAFASISIELAGETPLPAVEVSPFAELSGTWVAALHSVAEFSIVLLGGLLWGVAYAPYALAIALIAGLISLRYRRP